MARRGRGLRRLAWAAGGLVLGVILVVLVLNAVARTERGHEFVLRRTLQALGGAIKGGTLEIERIDGNLFQGAKVYGLRLADRQGRPFVVADSAYLDYQVTTLLSPRIHVNRAVLFDPEIYVFKLPGDTLWNYQAIFADTVPRDPGQPRVERLAVLDTVSIVNGLARVQTPWSPDSTLSPRAQRRMVDEALADTSLVLVDRVPGGYIRTMNFTALDGRITDILFAPGSELGSRLHVDALEGRAQIFRDTVRFTHIEGQVALLPEHVELDAPVIALRHSVLSMSGVVRTAGFPEWFDESQAPMYDLAFRTDSIAFRDLRWLYPRFPEEATGALTLRIEHRPEGLMFLGRDADIRAPGTHVTGDFGMILGDTLQFVDVEMEADPIDVDLVEQMLPEGLPVVGLRLGGVTIRGVPVRAGAAAGDDAEEPADDANEADSERPAVRAEPVRPPPAGRPRPEAARPAAPVRPPPAREPVRTEPRTPAEPARPLPPGVEPGSATEAREQAEAAARARADSAARARAREP